MAGTNFLERFRPLGAPGAATAASSTPSDEFGPATELVPVFAALAATVEECRALVERANLQAAHELADARERANAVVAQARIEVGEERARAAAGVLRDSLARDSQVLQAAQEEAARVAAAGEAQVGVIAGDVIERLLSDLLPAGDLPAGDLPAGDLPAGDLPAGDLPPDPRRTAPLGEP